LDNTEQQQQQLPQVSVADLRRELAQLQQRFNHLAERYAELRQTAWDAVGILGVDQEEAAVPDSASLPDLARHLRQHATWIREEYDELREKLRVAEGRQQ
jgi:hypothetical protein